MDDFFKDFKDFIKKEKLLKKKDSVLLAVSGGIDSMVMVDLFLQSKWKVGIAHCNFSLRGEESEEDAKLVEKAAEEYGVPFFNEKFDTEEFANHNKISIQEAARILRYEWLETIRQEHDFDYIATAHHVNDSLETVLFNFTKGTGIRGLHGILPKKQRIIRPLLFAGKKEIRKYAQDNGILYREDSSNASDKYSRNFVRHQVVPKLKTINPNFEKTAARNIKIFREVEKLYDFSIQYITSQIIAKTNKGITIDRQKLSHFPAPETVLYEVLKPYGFHQNQVSKILSSEQAGKIFQTNTHTLLVDRMYLVIQKIEKNDLGVVFINEDDDLVEFSNGKLLLNRIDRKQLLIDPRTNFAYFDKQKLRFPLKIRKWKNGDKFCPFGMNGKHKLVSDELTSKKVNLLDKENIMVLESEGEICWVIGVRSDFRFKIEKSTQVVIEIKYETL